MCEKNGQEVSCSSVPFLAARHLSKGFSVYRGLFRRSIGQLHAVDDISFTLAAAETLGVVGESGCGKSTLARLIMGLVTPDEGCVELEGRPLPELSKEARPFQMVFQDPFSSLDPRMRIGESVAEPLLAQGIPGDIRREKTEDMLKRVGLDPEAALRYPHQFSGGQRQRIAIARALVSSPRMVVFDEAVSALDASVRAQVLNLLCDLQRKEGFASLFISHDLAVVSHMADRIIVMYLGRIVEEASRDALLASPMHPYTRMLLACAPSLDGTYGMAHGDVVRGEPPSPVSPPAGCAFHLRCPMAIELCREKRPYLRPVGQGRLVACHRSQEGQ